MQSNYKSYQKLLDDYLENKGKKFKKRRRKTKRRRGTFFSDVSMGFQLEYDRLLPYQQYITQCILDMFDDKVMIIF